MRPCEQNIQLCEAAVASLASPLADQQLSRETWQTAILDMIIVTDFKVKVRKSETLFGQIQLTIFEKFVQLEVWRPNRLLDFVLRAVRALRSCNHYQRKIAVIG